MKKQKLSIVMPAKNEEKRIARTLGLYGSYFDTHKDEFDTEIIVVVNNTKDKTSKIVDDYIAKYPFIKKVETYYASGKGGAVAFGFSQAEGDYIGFVDADGSVPASDVSTLFDFLEETPWLDGIIGVRSKQKLDMTLKRRFLSKVFNLCVKFLFNFPYNDTQCGVKLFKKKAAKQIASKLSNTGWVFDVNLLLVAKYLNFRIMEHPVRWSEKEGSQFSFYEGLVKAPIELIQLKILELSYHIDNTFTKLLKLKVPDKGFKNVLIFAWRDIKHPEMGGSEVYVHEIAKRLAKQHNVTLFTSRPGNLNNTDKIDNVSILRRGNFVTVYFWAFFYYITKFRSNTDFIIDVENGIPFFTPLFSTKPKLMILHHLHKGQWFKQFPLPIAIIGYLIESILMPLSYRSVPIITVSPSSMSELKKIGFKDRQIYLAYNSIPPKIGGTYKESKTPLLAYIGRIKIYKRIEVAVRTLKELLPSYPSMKLVIGGTGDHVEKLKAYVKKLGLDNHVEFLGFISEEKKWEVMQKAWLFLMPSFKEGWGITIVEAASCATPAVGFDVAGVRDSIRNGFTGFLAEDENDYILKTKFLLDTPKARRNMGYNCKAWASMFSWNTSAKVFSKIIDASISSKGFLADKTYPWELDLRTEALTTIR